MEKSKNKENSLAKVMQAQAELLKKLTARVEQLTSPASAEHEEVIRTRHWFSSAKEPQKSSLIAVSSFNVKDPGA